MEKKMGKKKGRVPVLVVRKGATLREIYARARQEFTAADLQRYTELDEGVPADEILAEMEEVQKQADQGTA